MRKDPALTHGFGKTQDYPMAEELGKIEKPPVSDFKKGRKLFFVPVIYRMEDTPEEYAKLYEKYWEQVTKQLFELTIRLGNAKRIYHELVPFTGDEGCQSLQELNEASSKIVKSCLINHGQFEALEDADLLTEYMDWSRCLMIGLQNQKVMSKVYECYAEAGKKRNEIIAKRIDETLQPDEIGIVLMRENHQVQFPPDIQVFYIAPPALDEIKRWVRETENKQEARPENT
jgi:hypothetical protein